MKTTLCLGGRGGWGCHNFWCWVQICPKPEFPMSAGREGWCPNFWCWVQNCQKPKIPMSAGRMGECYNFWYWVHNCLKANFPMSAGMGVGVGWYLNFWYRVPNWIKSKFPMSAGGGGWELCETSGENLGGTKKFWQDFFPLAQADCITDKTRVPTNSRLVYVTIAAASRISHQEQQ